MSDSWGPAGPAGSGGSGSRFRRPLILAGVAAAALGSGAGVAVALTSGSTPPATSASASPVAASPSPSGPRPPGRIFGPGRRSFGGPGFFRGPAGAIAGPLGGLGFFGAVHAQSGAVATASRITDLTLLPHVFPFGQRGVTPPSPSASPGGTAG